MSSGNTSKLADKDESIYSMQRQQCQNCYTPPVAGKDLYLCSQCRRARYCNAECQKKDWKFHKKLCKARANVPKVVGHSSGSPFTPALLQDFTAFHRKTINLVAVHALSRLRLTSDYNETNACLYVEVKFEPKRGTDPAKMFSFIDARVVPFDGFGSVEPMFHSEGALGLDNPSMPEGLRNAYQILLKRNKPGSTSHWCLTLLRCGDTIDFIPSTCRNDYYQDVSSVPGVDWKSLLKEYIDAGKSLLKT